MSTTVYKPLERIAQVTWITYILAAAPIALLVGSMLIAWIPLLGKPDLGVIEEPPVANVLKIITFTSLIMFPVAWGLGVTVASRFNHGILAVIPFVIQMIPLGGLLYISVLTISDEQANDTWIAYYIVFLLALLLLGTMSVVCTTIQKARTKRESNN